MVGWRSGEWQRGTMCTVKHKSNKEGGFVKLLKGKLNEMKQKDLRNN
jgi:hypothetical protein